jgi:hypothetical protein
LSLLLLSEIKIYKAVILPVALHECETWLVILKVEHRLRDFGNRVLRKIFETKWHEMARDWRRLHNEGFRNLKSSPIIFRVI